MDVRRRRFLTLGAAMGLSAAAPFPGGNLSFLDGIPAIGNKFHPAASVGPVGRPNTATGTYARTLYFHFGTDGRP
ncbi:hypothetical protein KNE206_51580 [Kitasatospora sp. NE20-6]|uniref:hypothetical protein n=1 Tax=Kitasatospora sp. NE20-6 TaxID=2859066 RepID=UPI0034DBC730